MGAGRECAVEWLKGFEWDLLGEDVDWGSEEVEELQGNVRMEDLVSGGELAERDSERVPSLMIGEQTQG